MLLKQIGRKKKIGDQPSNPFSSLSHPGSWRLRPETGKSGYPRHGSARWSSSWTRTVPPEKGIRCRDYYLTDYYCAKSPKFTVKHSNAYKEHDINQISKVTLTNKNDISLASLRNPSIWIVSFMRTIHCFLLGIDLTPGMCYKFRLLNNGQKLAMWFT
jgi:hypothetical protein